MNFVPSTLTMLLIVANVFGVGMLVPQARRLARTKRVAGVSPRWIGLGVGINTGWLAYGFLADLPGLLPVSAGALALYGWMLITLAQIPNGGTAEAVATAVALLVLLAAIALTAGIPAMGVIGLGFLYTVQFVPAARESFTSIDLSGIAPTTWAMALIEAAIWAFYGVSTSDVGLLIGGIGASVMSSIVLFNVYRRATIQLVPDSVVSIKTTSSSPAATSANRP